MAEKQIIPVYTLSGGVSRQPASKRTPYQAEELDNCLVTLERSVEKRPGFSILPGVGQYDLSFLPVTADPHFTWFQLDRQNRYLIIVDRNATSPVGKLFYVLNVTETGWTNQTSDSQWDPDDARLQWNGTDTITDTDPRYVIKTASELNLGTGTALQKYNAVLDSGVVKRETREYITYGTGKVRDVLKSLQFGTNIIFLNTKVYAGFTSGTNGYEVALDGTLKDSTDVIGGKVTYYSAVRVVKTTDGRMYPQTYTLRAGESFDPDWVTKFVPVEDYVYGDFEKPWLGQSVRNFGDLRFPPDNNDWIANNSNIDAPPQEDDTARDMLKILYDDEHPHSAVVDGRGKIYFCDAPYLALDAGYYRVISFPPEASPTSGETGKGKPYTQKVRTPDYCSVIDKKRMPQNLSFSNGQFSFGPINWSHRTIGDRVTNPGPSPFLTENGEARHVQITAITNFRDRLFFASGDILFSSQMGVLEDLWIKDPSNVQVSDPIDIRSSSNSYAEITAMIPFDEYLFINTKGGVQFELKGDSNLISPLTAEISSTTFYSTADLVEPQTLGSQIYFLDKKRLYIYFNKENRDFNTALELSNTVPNYLPTNFQDVTTAPSQNYIMCVDEDARNNIYVYCNRFDGGQLIQSAFWRYILLPEDNIYGLKVWDTYLYAVVKRVTNEGSSWYLMSNLLEQEAFDIPRLDSRTKLEILDSFVTAEAIQTTLVIPYLIPTQDCYVVLSDGFSDVLAQSVFKAREVIYQGNQTVIKISGIDLTEHIGKYVYVGNGYEKKIRLSQQFVRDGGNNVIEGMLNLKTMQVRHCNTGSYRIEVTRRGRPNKLISEFSATNLENDSFLVQDGLFTAKVFGFSDEVVIDIINDTITPSNITQIEFKTMFNRNNSSLR